MEDKEKKNLERIRIQEEKISMMDSKITDQNNMIASFICKKKKKIMNFLIRFE